MMRALLLLSLLICCITSINTDDTLDTTVKKRRGRPKKVNTEPGAVKVTTRPIVISSGEKEKVTNRQEVTTTPPGVTNPGGSHSAVVLSATKTTFDEYETWFDSSGFWQAPLKERAKASTDGATHTKPTPKKIKQKVREIIKTEHKGETRYEYTWISEEQQGENPNYQKNVEDYSLIQALNKLRE
uniref:Uncharacterized protein n=1 Tax=Cacopsylla melanoneura TaxID=428564 RepID=A0A8D8QC51_9HEMI